MTAVTSRGKVAPKAADVAVLLVGIDGSQEGEEHDRANCTLPGLQETLIGAVAAVGSLPWESRRR